MDLAALGLTKDELIEMVVERCAKAVIDGDEDGGTDIESAVNAKIQAMLQGTIEARVNSFFDVQVAPAVDQMVNKFTIQPTNSYGEPKQPVMSLTEYIVKLADDYINAQVDYAGKDKRQSDWNFKPSSTRIAYMIQQHIHYHCERAIKAAIGDANKKLADALVETVKINMAQIVAALDVKVTVTPK